MYPNMCSHGEDYQSFLVVNSALSGSVHGLIWAFFVCIYFLVTSDSVSKKRKHKSDVTNDSKILLYVWQTV